MLEFWSIDLRHFLLPDGKVVPLPPRGKRRFDYWKEIASQATQYDDRYRHRRQAGSDS